MPKVWNKRDPNVPADAVYVGRPTKWGNPYKIGPDGTREQVIHKYNWWLATTIDGDKVFQAARRELIGKDLVCWCAPHSCHADTLMLAANTLPLGDTE